MTSVLRNMWLIILVFHVIFIIMLIKAWKIKSILAPVCLPPAKKKKKKKLYKPNWS